MSINKKGVEYIAIKITYTKYYLEFLYYNMIIYIITGDYVIARMNDRRDFDNFRDLTFQSSNPIIASPLLIKFMKYKGFPIDIITEFENVYITSMPTETFHFDELCTWIIIYIYIYIYM